MHQHGHQHISMPIKTMMQCVKIATMAIERENHEMRRLKIATSTIFMYASRMLHLIMKAIDTTNM